MKYELDDDGVLTGIVKDFTGSPPGISHKGRTWRLIIDQTNPSYDPETEKLGPITKTKVGANVRWERAVVDLTDDEKWGATYDDRRLAYKSAVQSVHGVAIDEIEGIGIVLDAVMEKIAVIEAAILEIDSEAALEQSAYDALRTAFLSVKASIPGPT